MLAMNTLVDRLSAPAATPVAATANTEACGPLTPMDCSSPEAFVKSLWPHAKKAAQELGVDLVFDGPTDPDPAKQNEIVENWITLGVDAIAVACENREGISTALRKARSKGIKVITYDADALPDAREFFVNQATPEGIGFTLMDEAARLCGNEGEFAIITASLTAANMIERPDGIKIASWFIVALLVASFGSRLKRSTELRFQTFRFVDAHSQFLWDSLRMLEFPVLVPHRPGRRGLDEKEAAIRERHRLAPEVPIVFCETRKLAQEWTYRFLAAAQVGLAEEEIGFDLIDGLAPAGELPAVEPTAAEIRLWATQHGHHVSDRGRIPAEVKAAFLQATR